MPPSRKKSVNKQFPTEVSPQKKARNWEKNVEQVTIVKGKSAYKLGPPWHETEIQKFYKAYRKHGKDWKRVAAEVSTRSLEMVEALYKLHRAYLSLPEGTASVHGLIAMVSDHYSVHQASSGSEREDNGVPQVSHKSLKRKRVKVPLSEPTELPVSTTADGCMSLLKRVRLLGGQPRVVGKRTPRFPVSYNKDNGINHAFQRNRKLVAGSKEEEVAHVAALVLTETSRRGGSQISQTSRGRIEQGTLSLGKSKEKKAESPLEKLSDVSIHGGRIPGARSKAIKNVAYDGDVGSVERKEKKIRGKKMKGVTSRNKLDGGEVSGGMEEGQKLSGLSRKVYTNVSNGKLKVTSPQGERSNKLFSGDEFSALDALQTLANLSVMESESSAQMKEETSTVDLERKSVIPKAASADHDRDATEVLSMKAKARDTVIGVEATTSRKSKSRRVAETDARHASEAKQPNDSLNDNTLKRKRPSSVARSQAPSVEADTNPPLGDLVKAKDLPGEDTLPVKEKQTGELSGPSKQLKSGSDHNGDRANETSGPSVSAENVVSIQASLPMPSRKSRRKRFPNNMMGEKSKAIVCQGGTFHPKDDISSCLSSPFVRRWCTFEWFYSAIDYPWFAKPEFVEYLNHVGLGHIPTLTRVEWGVIRNSLGKPRRFSERFLHEERGKLQQYRESVRKNYSELRAGIRSGLPTDLARPLCVGQRVIAIHPRTRELHNGRVLTVDHEECRVQFDNAKIGVEVIKDMDCMPFNPMDNMPEALKRQNYFDAMKELEINGYSDTRKLNSVGPVESVQTPINPRIKQAQATDHATSQFKALGIQAFDAQNFTSGQFLATPGLGPTHLLDRKQGNQMHLPWLASLANPNSYHSLFAAQDTGSAAAAEIVNSSREKAHKMLDAALQAFSSKKEGEDGFATVQEALDKMDSSRRGVTSSTQAASGSSQAKLSSSLVSSPSELMTSCVATLLMIKMCTERQYPPADMAQIIDSAVTNLQPSCSQNLPIYREIQTCMGRIKTQILALVPT